MTISLVTISNPQQNPVLKLHMFVWTVEFRSYELSYP
jgi:hypothetical protein